MYDLLTRYSIFYSLESVDSTGRGPLHIVAQTKYSNFNIGAIIDCIDLLLKFGINLQARDNSGKTALFSSTRCGNWPITKHLLEQGINPGYKARIPKSRNLQTAWEFAEGKNIRWYGVPGLQPTRYVANAKMKALWDATVQVGIDKKRTPLNPEMLTVEECMIRNTKIFDRQGRDPTMENVNSL
jgi:hypothetical protein